MLRSLASEGASGSSLYQLEAESQGQPVIWVVRYHPYLRNKNYASVELGTDSFRLQKIGFQMFYQFFLNACLDP